MTIFLYIPKPLQDAGFQSDKNDLGKVLIAGNGCSGEYLLHPLLSNINVTR